MRLPVLFFVLLFTCSCTGQIDTDSKEVLSKDIDAYRDGIVKYDVDPFREISKQQFFDEIEKIKKDAVHKNADEVITAIRKLNAKLCDEHSRIGGFKETWLIPVMFYWFEEGIFIIRADPPYSDYLFSKVIAINHIPLSEVVQKIGTLLPNKNEGMIKEQVPSLLSSTRVLHGLGIIDDIGSVPVTIGNRNNNDTISVVFESRKKENIILRKSKIERTHVSLRYSKKENYWYQYDSSGNFIYFNYSSCLENNAYPIRQFTDDFFKEVKKKKPDKIIIDLRDNEGGHRTTLKPFIDELNKSALNKSGHVFVLIGRKTFSAAMNNVFDLARAVTITTVGESTSASINHLGQVRTFKLPNSGLTVSYSTNHIINDPKASGPLKPDVIIPETLSDFLNGKDAALDYAVAH